MWVALQWPLCDDWGVWFSPLVSFHDDSPQQNTTAMKEMTNN